MGKDMLILAIRPVFAERIMRGRKTVELRRVRPKQLRAGSVVLLYASSPVRSMIGAFTVERIIEESVDDLWQSVREKAALSRREFNEYFDSASKGVGIFIRGVWSLSRPFTLNHLRQTVGFRPPRSFRYPTAEEASFPWRSYFRNGKVRILV